MTQNRYTIQQHHLQMNTTVRLSHINTYHLDNSESDIFPGHPYAKIFFVQKGSGIFHYQDISLSVQAGSLILINPERNKFSFESHSTETALIVLGVENLCFLYNGEQPPLPFPLWEPLDKDCAALLENILREAQEAGPSYEDACLHYLRLFLIFLQRNSEIVCSSFEEDKCGRDCQDIKEYLDEHFSEPITLDSLARSSGLNKYYLVHAFTKKYNRSPISYLNEKRIDESKKLLEQTNYTIAEISRLTGFSSQSYFSQAFRKKTLMTPNEYRHTNRHSQS